MKTFSKKGITITRTDTIYGLLEQGGVSGRRMFLSWSAACEITKMTEQQIRSGWNQDGSWNDWMSVGEFLTTYICDGHYNRLLCAGSTIH